MPRSWTGGGPQHQRHVVRHTKVVVIHPWRQRRLEEEWWRLWIGPVHKALEVVWDREWGVGDVRPVANLADFRVGRAEGLRPALNSGAEDALPQLPGAVPADREGPDVPHAEVHRLQGARRLGGPLGRRRELLKIVGCQPGVRREHRSLGLHHGFEVQALLELLNHCPPLSLAGVLCHRSSRLRRTRAAPRTSPP